MSKKIKIGNLYIGGGERIKIQSMATCRLCDTDKAINTASELYLNGCDILRFSVLDELDAKSISKIKKNVQMPIVADIHFDYKLAIESIISGADKIRINPGNIGNEEKVKEVAKYLKEYAVPVRVGSNMGSLDKEACERYGRNEISLAESALKNVAILEKYGVENIVVSVKSSSVPITVKACEYISKRCDYPLHIGVTEAGTEYNGVIKNAVGIGALLLNGIGDTIRVSLSADPVREVVAAKAILTAVGLKDAGAEVIACPTCGRCEWDCMKFASEVEDYLKDCKKNIKVAVMGCVVNGPGEAKDADLGIAGAKDECAIFIKGKIAYKVKKEDAKKEFFKEIDKCLQ